MRKKKYSKKLPEQENTCNPPPTLESLVKSIALVKQRSDEIKISNPEILCPNLSPGDTCKNPGEKHGELRRQNLGLPLHEKSRARLSSSPRSSQIAGRSSVRFVSRAAAWQPLGWRGRARGRL